MPNSTYDFASSNGQTITFDAATDILTFGAGFSAAQLKITQGPGTGANATVIVTIGATTVTLKGITIEALRANALSFADGSVALIGDSTTNTFVDGSANTQNGGTGNDYLSGLGGDDILNGGDGHDTILTGAGNDTVTAGAGNDVIEMGSQLLANDRIDGGSGFDTLKLDGLPGGSVSFVDGTVKNIERIELAGDATANRAYNLTSHETTVAAGEALAVDASALDATDSLTFNGSAETNGTFTLTGGAGADNLRGGAGNDTIVGGSGNDIIAGGLGADVLTGGAGEDIFTIGRGAAKSDSSPTSIDRITDFEGAGAFGGDRIDLPVPNGGRPLAFAGQGTGALNAADGFADISYEHVGGQTRIVVDVDDNGQITEVDQVILLDGIHNLQAADFNDNISTIRATNNADFILGSGGSETINGLAGADQIDAGAGNDVVSGGSGNDTIAGGAGSDTLSGDADDDIVRGGDNHDTLHGGDGNDLLQGDAGNDTMNGNNGNDTLEGGTGSDSLNGDAGDDVLRGGDENDTLRGGTEQDQLFGDAGGDSLDGGAGDDMLDGGADGDSLVGGLGADTLVGGDGNDVLRGDENSFADSFQDTLSGGQGADTLHAGGGRDILTGGTEADKFVVSAAASPALAPNLITDFSKADGDKLQLIIGGDKPLAFSGYKDFVFNGGLGDAGVQFPLKDDGFADVIFDYDAVNNVTRLAVDSNDDGVFSNGDLLIHLNGQVDLTQSDFVDTFTVVRGTAGNDVLPGTAGADTYYGQGGNDTITGEGGGDTLFGGTGDDNINGGEAGDTLYGEDGNDVLFGGSGVFSDGLHGGAGDDQLSGGEGNDSLNGNDGADTLHGDEGADTVLGGAGEDLLFGGAGDDRIDGGADNDTQHGGLGNDAMNGDGGNDVLNGDDNNDTLNGGEGDDVQNGGEGDDNIVLNAGADTSDGGNGNDTIDVGGLDTVIGGAGADRFTISFVASDSKLATQGRIVDYQQGVDVVNLLSIASGLSKSYVFNNGDAALGTLALGASLGNGGDGLNDVLYSTSADGLTTRLIVDLNDDGKLDKDDLVVAFNGDIDFTTADFLPGTFTVLRGSNGPDSLTGTNNADTIIGVGGNDTINGLGGNDNLSGQDGDDTIDGGQGADTINGGEGNDILLGGEGVFDDVLNGNAGDDQLDGGAGSDTLNGADGNDTLVGGLGNDTLTGGAGTDTLRGGDNNDTLNGGEDADLLEGNAGDDTLRGDGGNDNLIGGIGNDNLTGGQGVDTLAGGDNDDTLDGNDAADIVDGGAGNDTIAVGGTDTITGGAGADRFNVNFVAGDNKLASQARVTDFVKGSDTIALFGQSGITKNFVFNNGDAAFGALSSATGSQTLLGNGGDGLHDVYYSTSADGLTTHLIIDMNDDGKLDKDDLVIAFDGDIDFTTADFTAASFTVMKGTNGADLINGTEGADTIYGVGGNDQINGLGGVDTLFGQAGDDTIDGGQGNDTLEGGDGNDTLKGGEGEGADTLRGEAGNDILEGGGGSDTLQGGIGDDQLTGGTGTDVLNGDAGADTLSGGDDNDSVNGGEDADTLSGGLGNDQVRGDGGNDVMFGDDGDDTMTGGAGNDRLEGGEGDDKLDGSDGIDILDGGIGSDTLEAGSLDTVTGGAGADRFNINFVTSDSKLGKQAIITDYQSGLDTVTLTTSSGIAKNFVFNGGDRAFGTLSSTPGSQTVLGNAGDALHDVFFTTSADGSKTQLIADLNDDGLLDKDDLVVTFNGDIDFTTADFVDTFKVIRGTNGNDTLNGTANADSIYGLAGNDTINGLGGADELFGFLGDDTLDGGTENDTLSGGEGHDTLRGGSGDDVLRGEVGNDLLEGGDGSDTLNGADGLDTLRGGFGADTLNGDAGADTLEGGADNDTLNGGADNDTLLGQDGADILKGDAGDDNLQGGASADTLTGGAGNDVIDGGTEIDTAVFSGKMSEYSIVAENGGITVKHLNGGADGTDFLTSVEILKFSDATTQANFLAVSDAEVLEGDVGTKKLVFTVSIIGPSTGTVTVNYATANGSATAGSDYTAATGSLTFAPGETSKQVEVTIAGDVANEIDETLTLNLSNAAGLPIGDAIGIGTILNDDAKASIADASIAEGNSGTKTLTFTISLDKPAEGPVSIGYQTVDGTAQAGTDYVSAGGFVNFVKGETSKTVTVTVNGDALAEANETFTVSLVSIKGAIIADGVAIGTITNDDGLANRAPVGASDSYGVGEDGPAFFSAANGVLKNDSDPDGNPLTATLVSGTTNGTLTLNPDGSFNYVPNANFFGQDSFTYRAGDGSLSSEPVTVSINVAPVNDAPVTVADSVNVQEDGVATGNVLLNDTDVDGDALVAQLVEGPKHGSFELNANGTYTYTPNANFNGTDSFSYRANDGQSAGNVQVVTIQVGAVNDAPVATGESFGTAFNTALVKTAADLLANDSDLDGDSLSIVSVGNAVNGTVALQNGQVTFTPTAGFSGPASYSYTVSDGKGGTSVATVQVDVAAAPPPGNTAPVAQDDVYEVTEDTSLYVRGEDAVLSNDTDAEGNALTAVLVNGPTNGKLELLPNGVFDYTPNENFSGTDSFTYKANDGALDSEAVTVFIVVKPVNDAPFGIGDIAFLQEDHDVQGSVLNNDTDADGDTLTAELVEGVKNGTLTFNANGSFTYVPNENFHGNDTFTYRPFDGTTYGDEQTVTIQVFPVNDLPEAKDDGGFQTLVGQAIEIDAATLTANDVDADGDQITIISVQDASNGTVTFDGSKIVFTPNPGYTGPASFRYIAVDEGGSSTNANVVINVAGSPPPENTAPEGVADTYNVAEDGTLNVAGLGVLANDQDQDADHLIAILHEGPKNGTLTLQEDGSFKYVPKPNFHGTDSFTYVANDGTENSQLTTVTIVVDPVNDNPFAAADSFIFAEDGTLNVTALNGVLANDTDVDGNSLTAQLVQGPANGQLTLNPDGSFTYVPRANFAGTDGFTYQAKDGTGTSQTQTVTLNVTPVNDAPDAVNDSLQTAYQTPVVRTAAQLLANDTDVDGNTLNLVSVGNATNGTVSLANGSITFTPSAGYSGAASYSYTVSDGQGGFDTATVSVQVGAPPSGGSNDIFYSTAANEVFDGGAGTDTIDYVRVLGGVEVRLSTTASQNTGAGGFDTLLNIENLTGSRFDDKLYGSSGANLIKGGQGNDFIQGGAGDDILQGDDGDDIIDGGTGNDKMGGGAGNDTIDYQSFTTGVNVNLALTTVQNTGSAGLDQFSGFENIRGSKGNDVLTGDNNANRIQGQSGNDVINGAGGDDQLFGDHGDDVLNGGLGADILGGGGGVDRFIIGSLDGDVIKDFAAGESIDVSAFAGKAFQITGQNGHWTVSFDLDNDKAFDDGSFLVQGTGFTAASLDFGSEPAPTFNSQPTEGLFSLSAGQDYFLI